MDNLDDELRARLEALESKLPVRQTRPAGRIRKPVSLSLGVAGGLAAATLLVGAAAGAAVFDQVRGHPGLFAPGGPFHCTHIRQMSPPQAESALEELGYSVTWQVEDRGIGSSQHTQSAPSDGYIIEGVLDGRNLLLVVERGEGSAPVPDDPC